MMKNENIRRNVKDEIICGIREGDAFKEEPEFLENFRKLIESETRKEMLKVLTCHINSDGWILMDEKQVEEFYERFK